MNYSDFWAILGSGTRKVESGTAESREEPDVVVSVSEAATAESSPGFSSTEEVAPSTADSAIEASESSFGDGVASQESGDPAAAVEAPQDGGDSDWSEAIYDESDENDDSAGDVDHSEINPDTYSYMVDDSASDGELLEEQDEIDDSAVVVDHSEINPDTYSYMVDDSASDGELLEEQDEIDDDESDADGEAEAGSTDGDERIDDTAMYDGGSLFELDTEDDADSPSDAGLTTESENPAGSAESLQEKFHTPETSDVALNGNETVSESAYPAESGTAVPGLNEKVEVGTNGSAGSELDASEDPIIDQGSAVEAHGVEHAVNGNTGSGPAVNEDPAVNPDASGEANAVEAAVSEDPIIDQRSAGEAQGVEPTVNGSLGSDPALSEKAASHSLSYEDIPLFREIFREVPTDSPFGEFVKSLHEKDLYDLDDYIMKAVSARIADGRDKMFNTPGADITVSILGGAEDDMLSDMRRESVASQMILAGKASWTHVKLYFDSYGQLETARTETITEESFTPGEWKIARDLAFKSYFARK